MSSPISDNGKAVYFYEPKVETYADIAAPKGRAIKDTDVLVYAGISAKPGEGDKDQLTFKGASNNSAFTKPRNFLIGRHTARGQDVYLILRTNGMSEQAARAATKKIKEASAGLGGYSAKATQKVIADFKVANLHKEIENNWSKKVL